MAAISRKRLRSLFGVLVALLVFALFAKTLIENWSRVESYQLGFDIESVGATLLFTIAVISSGWLWSQVLGALGQKDYSLFSATQAHIGSWVMRYIPSLGQPLYKVNWATTVGIRRAVAFVGFLYESAFVQLASILGALAVLLVANQQLLSGQNIWLYSALLIGLAVAGLAVLRFAVNPLAQKFAKLRKLDNFDSVPAISVVGSLRLIIEFTVPRILNGIGVALLALLIVKDASPAQLFTIAAAFTIAGAIGILAVFVPSGLGVREAAFVAILVAAGFDVVDGIAISIYARLISTIADLVLILIWAAMSSASKKAAKGKN